MREERSRGWPAGGSTPIRGNNFHGNINCKIYELLNISTYCNLIAPSSPGQGVGWLVGIHHSHQLGWSEECLMCGNLICSKRLFTSLTFGLLHINYKAWYRETASLFACTL